MTASTKTTIQTKVSKSTATLSQQQLKNLAKLRTLLPTDELGDEQLVASLKRHGQLVPIVRRDGTIVDGKRRYQALTKLKIKPWIVDISRTTTSTEAGATTLLAQSFFEINGCRRTLNDAARAAMAEALATMKKGANQHTAMADGEMTLAQAAAAMGTSVDSISRWRSIKNDPELRTAALSGTSSLSACVRTATGKALVAAAGASVQRGQDINCALQKCVAQGLKYGLVYADPPWSYGQKQKSLGWAADPKRHYPVMNLDAIKAMKVSEVCAKDSVLFLWTPNCLIADAIDVMRAWGFKYVTAAVWVKTTSPATNGAILPRHETLLMGARGLGIISTPEPMKSVHQERVTVHSRKPGWFAKELERLYPHAQTAKVELFCRQPREGWSSLGNQAMKSLPPVKPSAKANMKAAAPPAVRKKLK